MKKNQEIHIIADSSEVCQALVKQLKSLGGKVSKKKLDIGDFII